jgi:hypothetical protein
MIPKDSEAFTEGSQASAISTCRVVFYPVDVDKSLSRLTYETTDLRNSYVPLGPTQVECGPSRN